ncbi:MAG: hypothetical protein KGK08_05945 [Acidobacteriota bacterium]|nr:hypothetical protein [Acidobacteriota bacterium]
MRNTSWIWVLGTVAWLTNAAVSLRLHAIGHARLALCLAAVFAAAGLYFRRQPN